MTIHDIEIIDFLDTLNIVSDYLLFKFPEIGFVLSGSRNHTIKIEWQDGASLERVREALSYILKAHESPIYVSETGDISDDKTHEHIKHVKLHESVTNIKLARSFSKEGALKLKDYIEDHHLSGLLHVVSVDRDQVQYHINLNEDMLKAISDSYDVH